MSFFHTPEYNTLKKVADRLIIKRTLKNVILYLKYKIAAIKLAQEKYNDIGYIKSRCTYAWLEAFGNLNGYEEYEMQDARFFINRFGDDLDSMVSFIDSDEY